jgi:hypothetical protein
MLYKDNTFKIHHLWALTDLRATTLSKRFNLIRRMNIRWESDYPEQRYDLGNTKRPSAFGAICWQEFWGVVAGMQGLKELNVLIIGLRHLYTDGIEDFLKPIHAVKQCDKFSIGLGLGITELPHIEGPFELRVLTPEEVMDLYTGGAGES